MIKDKQSILSLIAKRKKFLHSDIPTEYQDDLDIILAEREANKRKTMNRGYDVIHQKFFVYESVKVLSRNDKFDWRGISASKNFDNFDDYYEYLQGDIYDNACYYQLDCSNLKYDIDKEKLFQNSFLIDKTIDDYTLGPTEEEKAEYYEGEKRKKIIKKWINRFNKCDTLKKLTNAVKAFNESELNNKVDLEFFFWNYIFYDTKDKNRFNIIMQYIETGNYPSYVILELLCAIYEPDDVIESYFAFAKGRDYYRYRSRLKQFAEKVKQNNIHKFETIYFSKETHYYCYEVNYDYMSINRYFETLDELLEFRNYDLSDADLSSDIMSNYDFSNCITNENTILPINQSSTYEYKLTKYYSHNSFIVNQTWYNSDGILQKENNHHFRYFFDFIAFLNGDLSEADLLLCEGLMNLKNTNTIDFTNAKISSKFCEKFGIKYKEYSLGKIKTASFKETEDNEKSTELVLQSSRDMIDIENAKKTELYSDDVNKSWIYYVSDLHLEYKLLNEQIKSKYDEEYIIRKIAKTLLKESSGILLIVGDTACNFKIFTSFINALKYEMDNTSLNAKIVFTIGNHELWDFSKVSYDSIVQTYKELLEKNNMYLLENSIIYKDANKGFLTISPEELYLISKEELKQRLKEAKVILFGGLGFSGCNETFNAKNGIYKNTIKRKEEIERSKAFKTLYDKILSYIPDKNVIVCTHMPMDCWSNKEEYHENYIYVSGHTHKNYFYDDGAIRIYADNQVGYHNNNPHTKYLEIINTYDYLEDYNDGIHEITLDEYRRFYRGINMMLNLNWKPNKLYMLKKKGIYCFIHQTFYGNLTILNGGARTTLNNDIEYYYENMDKLINIIKSPLDKYTAVQKKISTEIKKIGGSGRIHGCIIDIDFYNHIYINPYDLKITPYYAVDIIHKTTYVSLPVLLKEKCPELYKSYQDLIQKDSLLLPTIYHTKELSSPVSQDYLDTDIYRASRQIRKMQKIQSNILTFWDDNLVTQDSDKLLLDLH